MRQPIRAAETESAARARGDGRWRRAGRGLTLIAAAATLSGCVALAERIATHLADRDLQRLEGDLQVFEADLALFRECLRSRGGTCEGSVTTALAHSQLESTGRPSQPIRLESDGGLAASIETLPANHPARGAYAALTHPVARQTAAVHDHLRGHQPARTEGVRVSSAAPESAGAPATSTIALDLEVDQLSGFHSRLLESVGSRQWESLDSHCKRERAMAAPEAAGSSRMEAQCRRIAFVKGYFEAYFRHGEFIRVDVELAGAVAAVEKVGAEIATEIGRLRTALEEIRRDVDAAAGNASADLAATARDLEAKIETLETSAEEALVRSFGAEVGELFGALAGAAGRLVTRLDELVAASGTAEIARLAGEASKAIAQLDTDLQGLQAKTEALDKQVVADIHGELAKVDAKLSNVFRVSNVGFVSRDSTFRARLPTLEIVLDPTASRLAVVRDADSGQVITSAVDLGRLGVATDNSGVGTGSSIGAEIVRVFFEAIFDAEEGLPAVAPANAGELRPTGLDLGAYSLPLFTSPMGHVDSLDLTRMTALNTRIAAQTRVLVSRVVEGIGPFSLDNESIEQLIVEAITTSVRKAAAKATWCWYACDLDTALADLRSDARGAAGEALSTEERRLQRWADGEAERVRLRLGISG